MRFFSWKHLVRAIGIAAFAAAPVMWAATEAEQAAPEAGQLLALRGARENGEVYYLGIDGKRYAFAGEAAFSSWYADRSGVVEVPQEAMAAIPVGGLVGYRPGTLLLRAAFTGDIYVVETGGALRQLESVREAETLFGLEWLLRKDDMPEATLVTYAVGAPLEPGALPPGVVLRRDGDGALFLLDRSGTKRLLSEASAKALRVQPRFLVPATAEALTRYPDGEPVSTAEAEALARPVTFGAEIGLTSAEMLISGQDDAVLTLRIVSPEAASLREFSLRIDAQSGASEAEVDEDFGGLVVGNNAQRAFSVPRASWNGNPVALTAQETSLDPALDESQTLAFSGGVPLAPGVPAEVGVRLRLNSLVPAGERYVFSVPLASILLARADGSRILPASEAELPAADLAVTRAGLAVEAVPVAGAGAYARGSRQAELARFSFTHIGSTPAVISGLRFQGYVSTKESGSSFVAASVPASGTGAATVRDLVPAIALYDGAGAQLAPATLVDAGGILLFSGLAIQVVPGTPTEVVLKADITSFIDTGANPDALAFDILDGQQHVMARTADGETLGVASSPNGGSNPLHSVTVRQTGTIDFSWEGKTAESARQREIEIGTLTVTARQESFQLSSLSFRDSGIGAAERYRLSCPGNEGVQEWSWGSGGSTFLFAGIGLSLPAETPVLCTMYVAVSGQPEDTIELSLLEGGVAGLQQRVPSDPPAMPTAANGSLTYSKNTPSAITVIH